jgi:20S proteasome alpha/beta subunit
MERIWLFDHSNISRSFLTFLLDQSRPFGVALLIAGCDENGPQL